MIQAEGAFLLSLPNYAVVLNPSGRTKTENQKGDNASLPPAQGLSEPEPQSGLQAHESGKNLATEKANSRKTQSRVKTAFVRRIHGERKKSLYRNKHDFLLKLKKLAKCGELAV